MKEIVESVYIGTGGDSLSLNGELERHEIQEVISLTHKPVPDTTTHNPLIDGMNKQDEFDRAVDAVRNAINREGNTLVHCQAARSRSVTVLTTAIAAENNRSFEDVFEEVENEWDRARPKTPLVKHGKTYLDSD